MKVTEKKSTPQAKTSAVDLAVSELNSFDVTEESIIHGVVIISSRSTKISVAPLGMILALFTANPAAIIKKIDVIFESIIIMKSL